MTRKRHTDGQIIAVLKEVQAGVSVQDLCQKNGISDATLDNRRMKYAGLEVATSRYGVSWKKKIGN